MENNKNNRRTPRAARRPDFRGNNVSGTSRREETNTSRSETPRVRYTGESSRSDFGRIEREAKARQNTRRSPSRDAHTKKTDSKARTGRELTQIRHEQRALAEAKKEEKWQGEVERVRGGVDKIMLSIIVILLALGALMVYSASYPTALDDFGDSFHYLKKHLIFMLLGGAAMIVTTFVPYTWYKKWGAFVAYGVSIVLLLAVLVIGTAEGEAKRWLYIGSFSIQPSEIMKVSLVLILAWYIDKYQKKMKERLDFKSTYLYNTLFPIALVGVACVLVLLEKHLSGTIIIGVIGLAVMLVGGCHLGYSLATTAVGGAAAVAAFVALNPYALKRITTFTSDEVDTLNEGWQTAQGILAIGSGGPFGVGFSESRQKFGYVSMAHNDFIFTIWCEELGFVGALVLVLLFVAFMWRGYVIAMRAPDTFSTLAVFGITTQVVIQAFLNMMVVCDIIPNTGISLPFFSYGGSSLIMLMAEMGIILSVSRQYYRKKLN